MLRQNIASFFLFFEIFLFFFKQDAVLQNRFRFVYWKTYWELLKIEADDQKWWQ